MAGGVIMQFRGQIGEYSPSEAADLKAQGWTPQNPDDNRLIDQYAKPEMASYQSLVDPATGKLKSQYQLGPAESLSSAVPSFYNEDALNKLRGISLSDDTSPYAKLQLEQQEMDQARQKDSVGRQAKTAQGDAWSQLAMRGGVSGGERERVAMAGAKNSAEALGGVNAAGASSRLNILSNDANSKMNLLQAMPGLEAGRADIFGKAKQADINNSRQADIFNIGNLTQDVQGRNSYNQSAYAEGMKSWAANKQAEAEKNSQQGGMSHICTAVHKVSPLSEIEWMYLKQVKDCAAQYPEAHNFYFHSCEDLVPIMREHNVNFRDYLPFVKTTVAYCREFGPEFAFDFYTEYLLHVIEQYAPEKLAAYNQAYATINK